MRFLSKQNLHDILLGCAVLGTGGGGSLEDGLRLIDKDLDSGLEFRLARLDEIRDDVLIASPYQAGSISPLTEEELSKYADLPVIDEMPSLVAFKALADFMGEQFYATVATELGGHNTAVALSVAAKLAIPIVDADPAGRSVPELQHSTMYLNDVPIAPLAVANRFGDVAIIKQVANDFRAEALVRSMAVLSQNVVGVTDHPLRGDLLKSAVIPNTLSFAENIGRTLREAKESMENPATKIATAGKGYLLFQGVVEDFWWEDAAGFTVGETIIRGTGEFTNQNCRIWYKNENIISWKDGIIHVTVPDLICVIDIGTADPVTNPNFTKGMEVGVVGLPAPKEWRTRKGLEVFGPKHFGYDIEYVPLEKTMV